MKKIKLSISYKEFTKKFSINQIRFIFKSKWKELLDLDENEKVIFIYDSSNPDCIIIKKYNGEENFFENKKDKIYLIEQKKLYTFSNSYNYIALPSKFHEIIENLGFRNNIECLYEEKKDEIRIYLPLEEPKKNVILFKVNKGGVGKTFLTCQVGHALAINNKKVLIITSDSQNNVLNYMLKEEKVITSGIIKDVLYNKDSTISLRKNLDFIPLESNKFGETFIQKLPIWIKRKKMEYDYILIDSVPTMKIDYEFVVLANKIIIPAFCDEATVEGIINLLEDIDIKDVLAIQINKYKNRTIENKYKELLEKVVNGKNILFGKPIKDMSYIQLLLDNKKTVFESKAKKASEVQDIIFDLVVKIFEELD